MTLSSEEVADAVGRYLGEKWNADVSITNVERIFGGASRETYRLKVSTEDGRTDGVVLRRDPPTSLIDTERRLEYGAYEAVYPTSVPVPEPLFVEDDPAWMGQPFSLMREIASAQSDVSTLTAEQRQSVGEEKWSSR
ncbi:MAG: hypothetical protein U5O39_07420 [Gammaproteobacteria bacterium]|nr:hypothetical protein [Gammaproteobacteria bacterium]